MRILIAPDSFKESMTATEAAAAMARGVRKALGDSVEIDLCPVADGGEGTMDTLVVATGGQKFTAPVTGPLGAPVLAQWAMLGDGSTAIVEMAQAAGLALVPPAHRDPSRMTTYGVGQLMLRAVRAGARKLIVCIGGSATHDGGVGMAQALGVRFQTTGQATATAPGFLTGGTLSSITAIDFQGREPGIQGVEIVVACDVTNPLFGPQGAAAVYGPQKGATREQVRPLDKGLQHLASLLPQTDPFSSGMGAAGGLGFGLVAFCDAKLARGIELVLQAVRFDVRVIRCDLVITGEGRLDSQSIFGKACVGTARAAARQGVKTIALVGSFGQGAEHSLTHGLAGYHAILDHFPYLTPAEAVRRGPELLEQLSERVAADFC